MPACLPACRVAMQARKKEIKKATATTELATYILANVMIMALHEKNPVSKTRTRIKKKKLEEYFLERCIIFFLEPEDHANFIAWEILFWNYMLLPFLRLLLPLFFVPSNTWKHLSYLSVDTLPHWLRISLCLVRVHTHENWIMSKIPQKSSSYVTCL